jgi:hypothetical protein
MTTKEQITVAIRASVRQRSRSAFREANYRERIRTYSDFVEAAIDQEIKRIEAECKDGKPLGPDAEPPTPDQLPAADEGSWSSRLLSAEPDPFLQVRLQALSSWWARWCDT